MENVDPVRKIIVVGICLLVGLLHFITGHEYRGPGRVFVNGYLIDILLPFAMYLLAGFFRTKLLQSSIIRAILVFIVGALSETLQFCGVPIFGRTFDLLDYLMFAIGVIAGILFERKLLSRWVTV